MDKYNIIEPSNNIADLTNDYIAWCQLPFDIRMHSNDSCIAMHGCTVIDLFNKYRAALLNNQAIEDADDNNAVVSESYNFSTAEDYEELLAVSKDLQKSPFIVIIDPDINNMLDLNTRYNSFNNLNEKNRRLSNDYSWQLWGYNVIDMYSIMTHNIDSENADVDSNNIVYTESLLQIINASKNFINRALIDNDIIAFEKFMNSFNDNFGYTVTENTYITNETSEYKRDQYIDPSIITKTVPWFTPKEQIEFTSHCTAKKSGYITAVKEAMEEYNANPSTDTERKVLELGWNPSVPMNEYNIAYAKTRQINFLENNIPRIVNLSNYTADKNKYTTKRDNYIAKPLFFILEYPEDFNQFANINHYNKAGISFNSDLRKIYTFNGVGSTFKGIKIERLYDYRYIDIVVIYLDEPIWMKIAEYCENEKDLPTADFASIYDILTDTVNDISPDNIKIIYAQYIDMLLRMASIDVTGMHFNNIGFCGLRNNSSIFKVYSGLASDYGREEVDRITALIRVLLCREYRDEFMKENNIPDSIMTNLIAKSIIYNTTD